MAPSIDEDAPLFPTPVLQVPRYLPPNTSQTPQQSLEYLERMRSLLNTSRVEGVISADEHLGSGTKAIIGSSIIIWFIGYALESGTIFDRATIEHGTPLRYILGAGFSPALDQGIIGMRAGGSRSIIIPASQRQGEVFDVSIQVPPCAEALCIRVWLLSSLAPDTHFIDTSNLITA
ncbi:hypothetical protein HGRIS_000861 [Hohenbuehelia grisea]|uniref:peptidylprolyl isomerase n=1 Tax=Hohenbuehelia grisea TaxID=104357 RepID=A0ABR3IPZ4_9AGAR